MLIDDTPLGWRLVIPNASRSLRHGRSFQASLPGWGARLRRRTSAGRGHEGYSCAPSRADCHPRTVSKALPFCHVTLRGQKPLPPGYPTHPKTLGDHLRKQRLDLGISQRELGGRLGVSEQSLGRTLGAKSGKAIPHTRHRAARVPGPTGPTPCHIARPAPDGVQEEPKTDSRPSGPAPGGSHAHRHPVGDREDDPGQDRSGQGRSASGPRIRRALPRGPRMKSRTALVRAACEASRGHLVPRLGSLGGTTVHFPKSTVLCGRVVLGDVQRRSWRDRVSEDERPLADPARSPVKVRRSTVAGRGYSPYSQVSAFRPRSPIPPNRTARRLSLS